MMVSGRLPFFECTGNCFELFVVSLLARSRWFVLVIEYSLPDHFVSEQFGKIASAFGLNRVPEFSWLIDEGSLRD